MPKTTSTIKSSVTASYARTLISVGQFMQYWGFKEVHGQVWACIFLAETPVNANYLIERLKLSKAAISLALKELIKYDVILELEKTQPSTRKYVSNPDLAKVILNVLRMREKEMLKNIVQTVGELSEFKGDELKEHNVSKEKAVALKNMSQGAQGVLEEILVEDDVAISHLLELLKV